MAFAAISRRAVNGARLPTTNYAQLRTFTLSASRLGAVPAGVVRDPMTGELTSLPDIEVRANLSPKKFQKISTLSVAQ